MPIYKKDQTLPQQPVIVLVYGEPGVSKTSLANTCDTPLNIDFDRGFKRSFGRPDVLMLTGGWKELEQELANGTLDNYNTIVIDTAKGALDDFLMAYVIEKDYKLKTNKLRAFGELGEQFKAFVNVLRLKGKDLFIIAHAKNQEDGDIVRKVPDVTGSSSALLLRIADQVGYMSMRNGQRVLSFNPTDTSIGKNVAGLGEIALPMHSDPAWKGFADREIIAKVKEALVSMSEEQREAIAFLEEWHASIDALILDNEQADPTAILSKEILTSYKDISNIVPEHLKKQVVSYFQAHLKKIGWKWFAKPEPGAFLPKDTTPVTVKEEAPAEQSESNPSGLAAKANDEPKEDLFAPAKIEPLT